MRFYFISLAACLIAYGGPSKAEWIFVEPKRWYGATGWADITQEHSSPGSAFAAVQAAVGAITPKPPEFVSAMKPYGNSTENGSPGLYVADIKIFNGKDDDIGKIVENHPVVGMRLACPVEGITITTHPSPNETIIQCQMNVVRPDTCPPCENPAPTTHVGNPIRLADGVKIQVDIDYASPLPGGVSFVRRIESKKVGFSHNYVGEFSDLTPLDLKPGKEVPRICFPGTISSVGWANDGTMHCFRYLSSGIKILRTDGGFAEFVNSGGVWSPKLPYKKDRLLAKKDDQGTLIGWSHFTDNDDENILNVSGKLLAVRDRAGRTQKLTYVDVNGLKYPQDAPDCKALPPADMPEIVAQKDVLECVTDSYGRQLSFFYNAEYRMVAMRDPAGHVYRYEYDGATANFPDKLPKPGLLTSVRYPHGLKRIYHYNEQEHTAESKPTVSLTGISEEVSEGVFVRYATYKYNAAGRAVSSEHAGGADKYSVEYTTLHDLRNFINPLGQQHTVSFDDINGIRKATQETQPGGAGHGPSSVSLTFDANNNIKSRKDWNGILTTYAYDLNRNLETKRIEAVGSPQERTVTTEWHPTYRLPTRIAEPKRITVNSYDPAGNLLSKTIQPTTDATGAQGFASGITGTPRTWSYTYNDLGQVTTVTGPRTDILDKTTYEYDSQGNLTSVTDAAGHITTLTNYDANGRVGKIVDPNGMVTEMTYHPRGWLQTKTIAGETTHYEYDGVGQLKKVIFPDNAFVAYTYDDAHRLTDIADSLGNQIQYTLDGMGNRIKEEVKDPTGALARQVSRVYDALNRLEQITGAQQ